MPYKALTYIMLGEEKYAPGMTINKQAFKDAGQTDENIASLIEGGAISEDMDADIDEAHQPLGGTEGPGEFTVTASDEGKGES